MSQRYVFFLYFSFSIKLMIAHSVLFFIIIVPRQWIGYDCGLYVCRYAAALHRSVDLCFTNDDLYSCSSPLFHKITCNETFNLIKQ